MINKESRSAIRVKKHMRVRNRLAGTTERPRLAVFRSNNHMYAQIIDDSVGKTLVAASTTEKAMSLRRQMMLMQQLTLVRLLLREHLRRVSRLLSMIEAVSYTTVRFRH
jgi:ribosomal protein L18